jgi:hypothetical protein
MTATRRTWQWALVLCAMLGAACGGDSTGPGGDVPTPPTDTPSGGNGGDSNGGGNGGGGASIPAGLAGRWMHGTISPTNFWDDHTGEYMGNAYGMADYVTLGTDGRYEEFVYLYSQVYSCRTQIWTSKQGTYTVDGDVITFHLNSGKYQVADNCSERNNYTRPMNDDEVAEHQDEQWGWQLGESEYDGSTLLYLTWPNVEEPVEYKPAE